MPDFYPNRTTGQGPTRRAVPRPVNRYGPGGLPTEGIDPAPKPWPIAPWLAFIAVFAFLSLQLWPATHYRHPRDPKRNWYPIEYPPEDPRTLEMARRHFAPLLKHNLGSDSDANVDTGLNLSEIDGATENELLEKRRTHNVDIFLCTNEKDLRPLFVVMNSTLSNARHPERVKFHLVIPRSEKQGEYDKFAAFLPQTTIDIVSEGFDIGDISKLIKYRKDSNAREELISPYNFLPYYLPGLRNDLDKIIYLDTDVIVMGDIEELYVKNLEGHPVGAVKDCSQQYKSYFDFIQLNEILAREAESKPWLPKGVFDEEECLFNRGILLIGVQEWIKQNVTDAIKWWMAEFFNSENVLYKYGLSQPPFLLALYKNYKELEISWNVRGLGRNHFSTKEQDYFEKIYGQRPDKKPFVSVESDSAKILHFNGEFKPWKRERERLPTQEVVSLCGHDGNECYKLWWDYLSPKANEAFKNMK